MSYLRYQHYKNSGIDWLGEVPNHWEVKRLRFVAKLNPSKSEINDLDRDTNVSFLPMDAIGEDGSLRLENEKPIKDVESGYTYFRDGDVTVAKITPCYENGKGALMQGLLNGIGFGTTELIVVRPKPNEVTGPYLNYIFTSPDFRNTGESHMYGAGGQKRVPDDFVRNFATAFPSISEQTQIAAFLDRETAKIDELAKAFNGLISLLKEKRQAVISHAVTKGLDPSVLMKDSGIEWLGQVPTHWEVDRLKRSTVSAKNGIWGDEAQQDENDIPCVRVADFDRQALRVELSEPTIRNVLEKERVGRVLTEGDLLLEKSGGGENQPVGFVVLYDYSRPAVCSNFVARVQTAHGMSSSFWRYVHAAAYAIRLNTKSIKQTSGIQNLDASQYFDERAAFPPHLEQTQIATFLDRETAKIDELTVEARYAIELLQERRTALISAAVTGKIDVRGLVNVVEEEKLLETA